MNMLTQEQIDTLEFQYEKFTEVRHLIALVHYLLEDLSEVKELNPEIYEQYKVLNEQLKQLNPNMKLSSLFNMLSCQFNLTKSSDISSHLIIIALLNYIHHRLYFCSQTFLGLTQIIDTFSTFLDSTQLNKFTMFKNFDYASVKLNLENINNSLVELVSEFSLKEK